MTLPDISRMEVVRQLVRMSLAEDLGPGDATSLSLVPEDVVVQAEILAREPCIVSGGDVVIEVFRQTDPDVSCSVKIVDGAAAKAGEVIMTVRGAARSILTAERTALNFMQRMTGIATLTAAFVAKATPYGVRILDTRKTTPCLRRVEKYAVACGGGTNHRFGLFDRIMIKDNHRKLWAGGKPSELDGAIHAARKRFPDTVVEIEVETVEELTKALEGEPDWILLDNMGPALLTECVALTAGRAKLEASGGFTMTNIVEIAKTGVDAISLGCLTHSAPSSDLSLEIADS